MSTAADVPSRWSSTKRTPRRPCARRRSWGCGSPGVDMLESNDGPQVMEVNSSPGLEGIETCTQLDVAGAIIDYIAAQVDFPEIDLRQRLTVSTRLRRRPRFIFPKARNTSARRLTSRACARRTSTC